MAPPEINTQWNEAYIRAALEVDVQKMPDRIVAACGAVAARLKDLKGDSDHHAERHEIQTAMAALAGLEVETRVWPTTVGSKGPNWRTEARARC